MPLRLVLKEGETRTVQLHGRPVRVRWQEGRRRGSIRVVLDDQPDSILEIGRDNEDSASLED